MRSVRGAFATCAVVAAASGGRAAYGQANTEPIRLDYRASANCPDESAFLARIRARTAHARAAMPGERARTFIVTLSEGAPPSGEVQVLGADGPQHPRRVEGGTCAEVADAIALVAALALDPQSSAPIADASTLDASAAALSVSPSPPTEPAPAAPTTEATHETPARSPEPPQPPAPSARPPASPASGDTGAFSLGADVSFSTGVSPNVLASLSPFAGWRMRTSRALGPSVRVSFFRAGTGALARGGADAAFTWTVGRVDLCPLTFGGAVLRVATCARLEAGGLEVAASNITPAGNVLRPWFAAGPDARGEWSFYRWAFVDADLSALFRATDDRFYFDPKNTTVYQVPLVGVGASLGLGVHFL